MSAFAGLEVRRVWFHVFHLCDARVCSVFRFLRILLRCFVLFSDDRIVFIFQRDGFASSRLLLRLECVARAGKRG